MKKISVKMNDAEYDKLERLRGDKSVSEFVRLAIFAQANEYQNDAKEFQQLLSDVAFTKHHQGSLASKKDLLALAVFITEVSSIANPPAYSNYRDKLQQLYNDLTGKIEKKG